MCECASTSPGVSVVPGRSTTLAPAAATLDSGPTASSRSHVGIIVKGQMLSLSPRDQAMLDGGHGPAAQLAMSILVRMADVYGASALMDVSQAHIDSTIYLGDATLEFAERLASLGARVAVPTSLNVSGVDECGWKDWAVSPEWAAKAARQMLAYERMGATPTWTCAPYQTHARPSFGQQIAWGESNA